MRKELAAQQGVRKKFKAVFSKVGKKKNFKGYSEDTILLTQIIDAKTDELVADHVWFAYTAGFEKAFLKEGDTLEFEARIKEYRKGYVNKELKINLRTTDYKLSHPTKIKKAKAELLHLNNRMLEIFLIDENRKFAEQINAADDLQRLKVFKIELGVSQKSKLVFRHRALQRHHRDLRLLAVKNKIAISL